MYEDPFDSESRGLDPQPFGSWFDDFSPTTLFRWLSGGLAVVLLLIAVGLGYEQALGERVDRVCAGRMEDYDYQRCLEREGARSALSVATGHLVAAFVAGAVCIGSLVKERTGERC
jgi:hypothetical protein